MIGLDPGLPNFGGKFKEFPAGKLWHSKRLVLRRELRVHDFLKVHVDLLQLPSDDKAAFSHRVLRAYGENWRNVNFSKIETLILSDPV